MDRPWQIDWSGGKIVVHAASADEAKAKALEYLKAVSPFRIERIKDQYEVTAEVEAPTRTG